MNKREKRKQRIRRKIFGTKSKPRLSVFRSNKHIYAQAIDDVEGKTIASASDANLKKGKSTKKEIAEKVGQKIGKKLKKKKIEKIVFDRSGYKFHGRVKELAEGIRKEGINF